MNVKLIYFKTAVDYKYAKSSRRLMPDAFII